MLRGLGAPHEHFEVRPGSAPVVRTLDELPAHVRAQVHAPRAAKVDTLFETAQQGSPTPVTAARPIHEASHGSIHGIARGMGPVFPALELGDRLAQARCAAGSYQEPGSTRRLRGGDDMATPVAVLFTASLRSREGSSCGKRFLRPSQAWVCTERVVCTAGRVHKPVASLLHPIRALRALMQS